MKVSIDGELVIRSSSDPAVMDVDLPDSTPFVVSSPLAQARRLCLRHIPMILLSQQLEALSNRPPYTMFPGDDSTLAAASLLQLAPLTDIRPSQLVNLTLWARVEVTLSKWSVNMNHEPTMGREGRGAGRRGGYRRR